MGNTIALDSQEQETKGKDNSKVWTRHCELYPKGMISKPPPFLEEPETDKRTERGEAAVSLNTDKDSENEREGPPGHTGGNGKLRYAVSEMQGWRSHMEDEHLLNPELASDACQKQLLKDHHLFAVFDGHGGDFASHFCSEHFVSTLIGQRDWKNYLKLLQGTGRQSVVGLQLLKSALTSTFLELDDKLMKAQRQRRLSQLSHLESLLYSVSGNVDYAVFQKGTHDHNQVLNFSKELPDSMPAKVPLERSGSTAVIVLVTPSHILCANAGDSRAILSKKSTGGSQKKSGASSSDVLPLSFDHKPNKDVEVTRVEKDGGFVSTKRVDGSLAVSRGFGDFAYKNRARDLRIDPSSSSDSSADAANNAIGSAKDHRVTVHPDIIVHNREPLHDEFVVLACDGIWDQLTNKECAELVRDLAIDEGEEDAGLICEEVIDTALELDSRDNMTICTVFFPAAAAAVSAPNIDSGVLKRRMDRKKSWGSDSTPAKRAQLREDERCKGKDAKGGTPSRSARLAGSRALRQKQELRRSKKVLESGKDKQRRQ